MIRARIFLAVALLAIVAGTAAPDQVTASARSFRLVALDTRAIILTDASMEVTERWTYRFQGGPFNFGIRTFDSYRNIVDFAARDDEGPLDVIPPGASESGAWEWKLRGPTSDTTVDFVVTYRVLDAVRVGADVGDLNWKFLGDDHDGVGRVEISVEFPPGIPAAEPDVEDDDASVLRGFAHGPSNGVIRVEESLVEASVDDVDAKQFVEIRALAPATAFSEQGGQELLADALAEERRIAGENERKGLFWPLTGLLGALGLAGTGALWFTGGRERKSQEVLGEYWREPLTERPAVALINLKRGSVPTGPAVAGTVVDLAQRGYLRIVGEREERIGKDETIHRYLWNGKPFDDDVVEYEKDVLEMIFRGSTETTSEEVDDWAQANQSKASSMLDAIGAGMKAEYSKYHFEEDTHGTRQLLMAGVAGAVAVLGIVIVTFTGIGRWWMPVIPAVLLFGAGSYLLRNRTQAGTDAAARAEGLKKFLKDFSRLEDAPVGHLILWERYLVYAVTLGVSAELLQGLTTRVPAVANDPNFGVWYRGPAGRFDGFDRMETRGSSLVSASTPKNTSGSGGGFSGGGSSGGGGGGGAGAR